MTRLMTEAFRRDNHMTSFAIHLFIDAFPAGWMKAIMDVERQPKPAYFCYREALTPLMANLRTDRYAFFAGKEMILEAWVCNDLDVLPGETKLGYQLELDGEVIAAQSCAADVARCGSTFQGFLHFRAPHVDRRSPLTVRLALIDGEGTVLHDTSVVVDVFPLPERAGGRVCVVGAPESGAARLAAELGLEMTTVNDVQPGDTILVDMIDRGLDDVVPLIEGGATAVLLNLPPGEHEILGDTVRVAPCGMSPRHFCSRATGHPLVAGLVPTDFWFWYDASVDHVTPLLDTTFTAPDWTPILTSGNGDWSSGWGPALAAAEKAYGQGRLRICQISLLNRTQHNPVAQIFARRLLDLT
jgi:hypothetical protein